MSFSAVDFPAPFGPMIVTTSPASALKETPFTICSAVA
jgi:hypothetical protein